MSDILKTKSLRTGKMLRYDLQFFGGRSAGSGLPESSPSGGGGNKPSGMDAQPGMAATAAEALGQKGRPMATTAAVSGANPFYSSGSEYQYNCQRAAVTTEARFRGYDVAALPTFDSDTMPSNNNYLDNFVGGRARMKTVKGKNSLQTQRNVEKEMASNGDGSRALIAIKWAQGSSGHVINAVQRNGKTYYYDGQNGTRVNAAALFKNISQSAGVRVTRVDDLPFSNMVNQTVRAKKR